MVRFFAMGVFAGSLACGQTATSTTLRVTQNYPAVGRVTELIAMVAPAASGTVTFLDDFRILGTAVLDGQSIARLGHRFTVPRKYRIRAVFAGSGTHAMSSSALLAVQVAGAPNTIGFRGGAIPLGQVDFLADVDGNGTLDVVAGRDVSLNNSYSFSAPRQVLPAGLLAAAVADFNGDGRPDIVTKDGRIALGAGDGSFAAPLTTAVPADVLNFSIDVNRDGAADLVSYSPGIGRLPGSAFYSPGNGAAGFGPAVSIPRPVTINDFDGNSLADGLFYVTSNVPVPASAFLNLDPSSIVTRGGAAPPESQPLLTGDVNGDGPDDIVTNRPASQAVMNDIVVELAGTGGSFTAPAAVLTGTAWRAAQLLDWNGDARLDVLVSQQHGDSLVAVGYVAQRANGSWSAVIPIVMLPVGGAVSVTELNADGIPDFFVQPASGTAFYFWGEDSLGAFVRYSIPESVTPSSGSGASVVFRARYSAVSSELTEQAIPQTFLLVNSTLNGPGGCFIHTNPVSREIRLWSDSENRWLGPVPAGSGQSLSTSLCSVSASESNVGAPVTEGGVLYRDITLALQFRPAFAGEKNVYLLSESASRLPTVGWVLAGTWTVTGGNGGGPPPTAIGPSVTSFAPLNGTSHVGTFTGTFSHSGGLNQIYLAYMLFLPTPNVVNFVAQGSCLVEHNRISNGVRLIDDAGTGWHGGVIGIAAGTPGATLSNSVCTVNVAGVSIGTGAHQLSVTVPVTFKAGIRSELATFLQSQDVTGKWTGMTQFGNWTFISGIAPPAGPAVTNVDITSAGALQTVAITAQGSQTALPIEVHLRIGPSILGAPVCHVVLAPAGRALALINADETALVGGGFVALGTNVLLNNGRCWLNPAQVAQADSLPTPGRVRLTVPVMLGGMTGFNNVYVNVFDGQGNLTHWRTYGPVTVP